MQFPDGSPSASQAPPAYAERAFAPALFLVRREDLPTLVLTSFSCLLLWVRIVRTGEGRFSFLLWNLFLALLPLWVGRVALLRPRRSWLLAALLLVWLALFPNAPYLVTDLVHLKRTAGRR